MTILLYLIAMTVFVSVFAVALLLGICYLTRRY